MKLLSAAVASVCLWTASASHNAQFHLEEPHEWGECKPYQGGVCDEYGMKGQDVFVYHNTSQFVTEFKLGIVFQLINIGATTVGDSYCVLIWKELYCRAYFPPCEKGDGYVAPKKMCKSACEHVHEECKSGFQAVVYNGFGSNIVQCTDKIGDPDPTKLGNFMYPDHITQWVDTLMFEPEETTTLQVPGVGSKEVACWKQDGHRKKCPLRKCTTPYFEMSVARVPNSANESVCRANKEDSIDCLACSSKCYIACPHPVYTQGVWDTLWWFRWLPSVLSLPFNFMVMVNEFVKMGYTKPAKERKKKGGSKGSGWVFLCALVGFLFAAFDGIPTMVSDYDLRCDGYPAVEDTINDLYSSYCNNFGRYCIHIFQILLGCVSITLEQLWRKLQKAQKMQAYHQGLKSKLGCALFVFGLPFTLFVIHTQQEVHDGPLKPNTTMRELTDANNIRYAFSCGPRFDSVSMEWALVMGPIILYGCVLVVFSILLIKEVSKLTGGSTTADKNVSKSTLALARAMTKFAICCFSLVVLNLCTLVPFLSKATQFTVELQDWKSCVATGVNLKKCPAGDLSKCEMRVDLATNQTSRDEFCGLFDASAPAPAFMAFIHLSYSLPCLVFGALFGFKAVKSLFSKCFERVSHSSVAPKGMTSTAASHAVS